ncbi:DUF6021 family protein [Pseudomonas sp. BW7P1]|uniref:DUF6021 family protein n=1 Tax=Pseudomonas TaxID=286 RepID=UPI0021ADFB60|nr:DUF6021 family protein [Pseudomonas sp. BW7P1]UWI59993.1 DUF6021 family protein [Pseudomonas sp. BW7P1]
MAIPQSPRGPHSSEHASGEKPGFDPDSPDLDDPQVDPVGPARAPRDVAHGDDKKRPARAYDPLADLKP